MIVATPKSAPLLLWVAAAFVVLLGAWAALFAVAHRAKIHDIPAAHAGPSP